MVRNKKSQIHYEKEKKVLLSFIGSNDASQLVNRPDGAILTALKNEKFDQVQLLWNKGTFQNISYRKIADYLTLEIVKRKLGKKGSNK